MATTLLNANYTSSILAKEKLSKATLDGADNSVSNNLSSSFNLNANTTPNATIVVSGSLSMTGSAVSLDLTSLTDSEGNAVNLSTGSKKVFVLKVKQGAATNGALTVAKGASSGYTGFGSSFSVILPAGNATDVAVPELVLWLGTNSIAVSASVKTIDFTGTNGNTIYYEIIAG
jgi:hypothetical protein